MFTDKTTDNFLQKTATDSNGLNGFFGRLAKKLIGLATAAISQVPIVGGLIASELTSIIKDLTDDFGQGTGGGGFWNKIAEYEPTPSEESILTAWSEKFNVFYKILGNELANAVNQSSIENKVTGINAVLSKICVVKSHFAKYETAGLSANAVKWRSEIIAELLFPIENIIEQQSLSGYTKNSIVFSVPTPILGYTPLFSATSLSSVVCSRFMSNSGNDSIVLLPDPVKNNIPVLPVGSENTIPNTLPAATEIKKTQNSVPKAAVWIAIAGVGAWMFSGTKKNKK